MRFVHLLIVFICLCTPVSRARANDLTLQLRYQLPIAPGVDQFHTLTRAESWRADETAVIICDVWDQHHCRNAVDRLAEFLPRLNDVVRKARAAGATIIHAPSDCMPAYIDHPARQRAMNTPRSARLPPEIELWCSRIHSEAEAVYPIDQSDGGADDDPQRHAAWAAELKSLGRNPAVPWKLQSESITIDSGRDYISDRGDEVWNVLEDRRIKHVILTGVHTNMCVLGRPFGLRNMVRGGRQVVLMRDMTDTMYNPARWPFVSHFTANDLIISHVERYVCPTVTSDQLLGGGPFHFAADRRPHLAIVVAEANYGTERMLPRFATENLGKTFRTSLVFGSQSNDHDLPGLEVLDKADALLLSVRRRVLKPEQMEIIRRFVSAGKPVIGIRTASHAFSLRDQPAPAGLTNWPEFDRHVFGAVYEGHPPGEQEAVIGTAGSESHPILAGLPREPWRRPGSLYRFGPVAPEVTLLLSGKHGGEAGQPVAWAFRRIDGGRSFYTSLGEEADFNNSKFVKLLSNAVHWACDVQIPTDDTGSPQGHWSTVQIPLSSADPSGNSSTNTAWFRCVIRIPQSWRDKALSLKGLPAHNGHLKAWFNGHLLRTDMTVNPEWVESGDANLFVVRRPAGGIDTAPSIALGNESISLAGRWQYRIGDDPSWSNMPLPAKFGASTDIVFPSDSR